MENKCRYCEFCFPHEEYGYVCAGESYGEDISKTLDLEKDCYSEGLEAFIKKTKGKEIVFISTTLAQLKIDGRKKVELTDKAGKTISVKASLAKELFGEIVVLRKRFEAEYEVDAVFNNEMFKSGNYLILK